MTFAETLPPPERERLTNRIILLNAAATVMRDKPSGSKLYMDCPRCWECGTTTWEVN